MASINPEFSNNQPHVNQAYFSQKNNVRIFLSDPGASKQKIQAVTNPFLI